MSWLVFAVTVVPAVPDDQGDVTSLFVATVVGALELALLGVWLSKHRRR